MPDNVSDDNSTLTHGDTRFDLAAAAVVTWLAFAIAIASLGPCVWSYTGQFGDSFGMLNTLVSSLAAVAAYKAFKSQQQQLLDQQQEFSIQRHEEHVFALLAELRDAVRGVSFRGEVADGAGSKLMTLRGVEALIYLENIFLGPVGELNGIVRLDFRSVNGKVAGYLHAIRLKTHKDLWLDPSSNHTAAEYSKKFAFSMPLTPGVGDRYKVDLEKLKKVFSEFHEFIAGGPLGNIFRLQAAVLRFIDSERVPFGIRELHADLFKAQMTDPEMHLLLYYALSDLAGGANLRKTIARYNVLGALMEKRPEVIDHRIPEIRYFQNETMNA